jgi:hypothetical protein
MRLTVIDIEDWSVLFADEKIVHQGHSTSVEDLVRASKGEPVTLLARIAAYDSPAIPIVGFRVAMARGPAVVGGAGRDPDAAEQADNTEYRYEAFLTREGVVGFWTPAGQTQLETMTMLLECFERSHAAKEG